MLDPELALTLTAPQLMLYCAGLRRWPDCPRKPACSPEACQGDNPCPPLSEWHGTMPAYLSYTGALQPIEAKKSPEALLSELPTVEEIDQVLMTMQAPVRKWRVMFIESVPHQIESTHGEEQKAKDRARELGEKYAVKEVIASSAGSPVMGLLERVKAIRLQVPR